MAQRLLKSLLSKLPRPGSDCAMGFLGVAFLGALTAAAGEPTVRAAESPAKLAGIPLRVLNRQVIQLETHSIIYNRVAPPILPAPPLPTLTAEVSLASTAAEPGTVHSLAVTATVHDRQLTEVRLSNGPEQFRAFSNIDFNYLHGLAEFDIGATRHSLLLVTGNVGPEALAQARQQVPSLAVLPADRAAYVIIEDSFSDSTRIKAALDGLHTWFQTNRNRLLSEYQARQAAKVEQERQLRENPPVKKNTVINFWPIKSNVYPVSAQ